MKVAIELGLKMILLVEDDPRNRRALAQILQAEAYEVTEAENGIEALEMLREKPFDLVVTDLVLPKLHGFDLVQQIRARWPKMPIIVISGYMSEEAGKIVLEGFAEFIQKPVEPAVLIAAIRRLLAAKV